VQQPLPPVDHDEDDRSLIEHGCMKEATQPWDLGHPPQQTARAVRVHVLLTRLMVALAMAYRLPCERTDTGEAPVGWQRWRRQRLEQTRDQVIVCAQRCDDIFPLAEYALRVGGHLNDRPPGVGPRPHILATCRLTAHG
jgi:hypothetical protein